jgi:hypothetical protein
MSNKKTPISNKDTSPCSIGELTLIEGATESIKKLIFVEFKFPTESLAQA